MNSVQEKMSVMNTAPRKKNDNQMNKRLGRVGGEIRYLGRSNQKIRRKLG
jgi:hypothetical protein